MKWSDTIILKIGLTPPSMNSISKFSAHLKTIPVTDKNNSRLPIHYWGNKAVTASFIQSTLNY